MVASHAPHLYVGKGRRESRDGATYTKNCSILESKGDRKFPFVFRNVVQFECIEYRQYKMADDVYKVSQVARVYQSQSIVSETSSTLQDVHFH